MCRGCLPTHVRLLGKGVNCPTSCASCASNHEDFVHVFFDCPFSIQVWNMTCLWSSVQYAIFVTDSATGAIFHLLENLSVELTQRLSSVIWSLWKHRNLIVWKCNIDAASSFHQNHIMWQPPGVGRYKCNIDVAFSSHTNRTGIGICVRDAEGTFVLAKAFPYPCTVPVDVGEA